MLTMRLIVSIFPVSLMVVGVGVACGQNYPNRPIRIVTSEAGGALDILTRLIAQGITGPLGQPVIVENRPSGVIPAEIVAKAFPDGYTLLLAADAHWIGPLLQNMPFDPVKEFTPITLVSRAPNLLVVHPSLPVRSVKELVTLAKAKPGALNCASSTTGSASHLAVQLFMTTAGIDMVNVRYKGGGQAINAVISGEVQLSITSLTTAMPHVTSGKLRALAVTSIKPSALAPDLPTVAASGVPGYETAITQGIFAPARMPATLVIRLNQEIGRFLNTATTKAQFLSTGVEVVASSPEEFAAAVKSEMSKWGKVIKDAGIRAE